MLVTSGKIINDFVHLWSPRGQSLAGVLKSIDAFIGSLPHEIHGFLEVVSLCLHDYTNQVMTVLPRFSIVGDDILAMSVATICNGEI
jgi:hypothetical protein